MKHLLSLVMLLAVQFSSTSQELSNDPLPTINSKAIAEWSKDITGWSRSPDGQWVSEKNLIPIRVNSRLSRKKFGKERTIGSDNIRKLELYSVDYGKDSLIMLLKYSDDGAFRYSETRRGWEDWTSVYYYIFSFDQIINLLNIEENNNETVTIPLVAFGKIKKLRGNAIDEITENLNFNFQCSYNLTVRADVIKQKGTEEVPETEKIKFQFYALHPDSRTVEGVINEEKNLGRSYYLSDDLLENLYYETSYENWKMFFSFNAS